jgi:hypothetical protein
MPGVFGGQVPFFASDLTLLLNLYTLVVVAPLGEQSAKHRKSQLGIHGPKSMNRSESCQRAHRLHIIFPETRQYDC